MIKKILLFLIVVIVVTIGYVYFQVNVPKVNRVAIITKKLPRDSDIKILQISDMHNKSFPNSNKKLFSLLKSLDSDIIVITGDLIDGKTRDFGYIYEFIEKLKATNKNIYYVSGNHEWRTGRHDEFVKGLEDKKVHILNNNSEFITIKGMSINLCGINDPYSGHDELDNALKNINTRLYTILLSHSPDIIEKKSNIPVDLILSGHTHGGQVRLPIIGALVAPGQGFFPEYDKGVFKIKDDTVMYIDSGLGTSTLPLRFLNRSQISIITIIGE